MYLIFFVLPIILLIPVSIYIFFFIKRIILCFYKKELPMWMQGIIAFISLMCIYPARNLFGFWALIILHFFACGLVVDIIFYILKKKNINQLEKLHHIGIIPLVCVAMILGYGYLNMKDVNGKYYDILTEKEISQSYRIALITDLHFGNTMNNEELKKYCQEISKEKPDIVLLGGDIVDERSTRQQVIDAFALLGQIDSQYGIYYVYGNHDRGTYSQNADFTETDLEDAITHHGVQILSDEQVAVTDDLIIIGREDRGHVERKSSSELFQTVDQDDFLLIFDHQPVDLNVNDELGYDLQLSGHTHGGQVFPVGLITDLLGFGEMNYGYRQLQHMQVVVSSGIAGWGYPVRTGSHSEYVIINVKRI